MKTKKGCHLCIGGVEKLTQPNGYIERIGKTCAELAISTFNTINPLTPKCIEIMNANAACCDGSKLPLPPKAVIPSVRYEGPNPVCDICVGGGYPEDPHHVINVLYVGADTCKNYYIAGKKGRIPGNLCDPIRYFAKSPCGCPPSMAARSIDSSHPDVVLRSSICVGAMFVFVVLVSIMRKRRAPSLSSNVK